MKPSRNNVQILIFFLFNIALILTLSCTDERVEKRSELKIESAPSAMAEDDAKATGIYKGSFVGSSGTFKVVVQLDMIAVFLNVDGIRYLLSTKDILTSDLGKSIDNALFTDSRNTVQLRFSVGADGKNPVVDLQIEGHTDIRVVVMKETSVSQVIVYEGYRYRPHPSEGLQEKGIINVVLDQDSVILIAYKTDSFSSLNNGRTGTVPEEAWISNGTYYNIGDQMTTSMEDYLHGLIPGGFVNINEKEIWASNEYEIENFTIADSVRLERKL